MNHFTTNTYGMKRKILNFSKKISVGLNKLNQKFISDMICGIEKNKSVLSNNIARALDEDNKLKNTIERLKVIKI